MAQIHNEIRKGWLSDSVNRALGRTREGGVERVAETCDVVMNPWGMPEWAYLRGERLVSGLSTSGAVAAELSMLAVVNPAGTLNAPNNLLVVVESVAVDVSAAGTYSLELTTQAIVEATLAAQNTGVARDRRYPVLSTGSRAYLRGGTDPANTLGLIIDIMTRPAAMLPGYFGALPVILPPGHALLLINRAPVNQVMTAMFHWRERNAYPGELV